LAVGSWWGARRFCTVALAATRQDSLQTAVVLLRRSQGLAGAAQMPAALTDAQAVGRILRAAVARSPTTLAWMTAALRRAGAEAVLRALPAGHRALQGLLAVEEVTRTDLQASLAANTFCHTSLPFKRLTPITTADISRLTHKGRQVVRYFVQSDGVSTPFLRHPLYFFYLLDSHRGLNQHDVPS